MCVRRDPAFEAVAGFPEHGGFHGARARGIPRILGFTLSGGRMSESAIRPTLGHVVGWSRETFLVRELPLRDQIDMDPLMDPWRDIC